MFMVNRTQRIDDFDQMKTNELAFQNAKYAGTSLLKNEHETSIEQFERHFLRPVHRGGIEHGLIFSRAVSELPKYDGRGKRILDYCCGKRDLGLFLGMKGARVHGFDFSQKAIAVARCKAEGNNIDVPFSVMDPEELLFPKDYIDFGIGFEALHHLIIYAKVPYELASVLRKG